LFASRAQLGKHSKNIQKLGHTICRGLGVVQKKLQGFLLIPDPAAEDEIVASEHQSFQGVREESGI